MVDNNNQADQARQQQPPPLSPGQQRQQQQADGNQARNPQRQQHGQQQQQPGPSNQQQRVNGNQGRNQQQQQNGQQQSNGQQQEHRPGNAPPLPPQHFYEVREEVRQRERAEDARIRQNNKFMDSAPRYEVGQIQWDLYLMNFNLEAANREVTDEDLKKRTLFRKLDTVAMSMVSPQLHPMKPENVGHSFEQYTKLLGEVFEPKAELESARMAYLDRVQQVGEHPTSYLHDKLQLFERAYQTEQRDYHDFYNMAIRGLINAEMKSQLRYRIPENLKDVNAFKNSMTFVANVVRRRFTEGEISEAEALGAEAYVAVTIRAAERQDTTLGRAIKTERIQAVGANRNRNNDTCYYCREKGHHAAQCPRKAAGMPAAVAAIQPEQSEAGESDVEERVEPVGAGNSRFQPGGFPRKVRMTGYKNKNARRQNYSQKGASAPHPPGNPNRSYPANNKNKKFNRRIMYVYEDEDGETYAEDIPEEGHPGQEDEEVVAQVADADHSESDYVPGAFLGKTSSN